MEKSVFWNDIARLVEAAPDDGVNCPSKRVPGAASWIASTPSDERAAAHYEAFVHDLSPCASVVLASDGLVGGSCSEAVHRAFTASGMQVDSLSRPPDHLAAELEFMGMASGAQASRFVTGHMSMWVPLLVAAFRRRGPSFFSDLMQGMEEALATCIDRQSPDSPEALTPIPPTESPLDQDSVGLAEIGRFLGTPARCGLLLTRRDLTSMGRKRRLPMGFGSRSRTIEALLRSAAEYDELPYACDALDDHVQQTRHVWTASPLSLPIWADEWNLRLDVTAELVRAMRSATPSP